MKPPSVGPIRFRPERLPLWLLLLALSTVFLCSADKGYFYRPGPDNWNTARNLAIAENLSPDHNFWLFLERSPGPGGVPAYEIYSRFPVGGYALIKLAILPFGNDLSARILAARMLMLLLFGAAAVLAFLSLARITSQPWTALAATLAAFSSYYMLYYGNVVSNELSMELFAVMLVFHGMVAFVQEGRFGQLLVKTCVALLLGWRVYAFLAPFLILGLASEAVRAWKGGAAPWPRVRSAGAAVLRSRYTALGVFAVLFGAAVLGFNFANEYVALGGETRVAELPSVRSMLWRTGLHQDAPLETLGWWLSFLREQSFRVGVASVPLVLTAWGSGIRFAGVVFLLVLLMVVVTSATVVCLVGRLLAPRQRMLVATLALSGFFWTLLMRHNAHLPHDALFYVGVPLVFYSLLLLYVHKRWGSRPVVGLAVAALLAFVVSTFQMDRRWRPDARVAEVQQATMAELGSIRETTRGKAVLILPSVEPEWFWQVTEPNSIWQYYLAGSVLLRFPDMVRDADFLVTRDRVEGGALLTPGNEEVFLYDSSGRDDLVELYRAAYQRVVSGDPAARSDFDVYLGDGALFHVREPCVRKDAGYKIFVQVVPEDPRDLTERGRGYGFEYRLVPGDHRFRFRYSGVLFDEKCMAILPLPDYPLSRIWTGQWPYPYAISQHGERRRRWEVEIPARR